MPILTACIPKALTGAVYSGARGFNLLTSEEQDFALNTTVQYAPRAYEFIRHCKATDDGLSIVNAGQEMQEADLTPFEWSKVHAFPVSECRLLGRRGLRIADDFLDGLEEQRHRKAASPNSGLQRLFTPYERSERWEHQGYR